MRKLLSFLSVLLFFFVSCSDFNRTSSVTLTLSSGDFSRSAARDIVPDNKEEGYYIVASIRGDYNEVQTDFLPIDGGKCTFSFESVPVGAKVYAEVNAFNSFVKYDEQDDLHYSSPNMHELTGKSETITVAQEDNYLNLEMNGFYYAETAFHDIILQDSTSADYSVIFLTSSGKYYIMYPDVCIYSEGTWRYGDSDYEKPFESEKPFTLYLTEYVYGKKKKDDTGYVYTTPVIVELPEEKAIKIQDGRNPYFKFESRNGIAFEFGENNGGGGDEPPIPEKYRVNISCPTTMGSYDYNGNEFVEAGTQVTFKVTPGDGYRLKSVKVTDSYQYHVYFDNLTIDGDGNYSFIMPADGVRVGIEFEVDTQPESEFVLVEGNTFTGSESWDPNSDVFVNGYHDTINSFQMCRHEVTQKEYATYCIYRSEDDYPGASDDRSWGVGDNYPVYYVSWYDAIVYCNLRSMKENLTPVYSLNGKTDPKEWTGIQTSGSGNGTKYCGPGVSAEDNIFTAWDNITVISTANGYRLPTEEEWEYAARGGKDTKTYIYSGTSENLSQYARCNSTSTVEVMNMLANSLGIFDMSGNVKEWCWTKYTFPGNSGTFRVLRGGSFDGGSSDCKVNIRDFSSPNNQNYGYGFRVVRGQSH